MNKLIIKTTIALSTIISVSALNLDSSYALQGDACKMGMSLSGGYSMSEKVTSTASTAKDIDVSTYATESNYSTVKDTTNKGATGFIGEIGAFYYVTDNISLGASFGYSPNNTAEETVGTVTIKSKEKSYNGMLKAKYDFIVADSAVSPFIGAGAGVGRQEYYLESSDNSIGYGISETGGVYTVSSEVDKIKKTSFRGEIEAGLQYNMGSVRLSASYGVAMRQGLAQKDGQMIVIKDETFTGAATDKVSVIKNYDEKASYEQILKLKMDYVF